MKKGWKIFWIILAACGGTGLVMLIVAFTMGFSINNLNYFARRNHQVITTNVTENKESDFIPKEIDGEIKELRLKADFCRVKFIESKEDRFYVDTTEVTEGDDIEDIELTVMENNGVFNIDLDSGIRHGHHMAHHHYDRVIYVYYPENYKFDKVDIHFGAGEIDIDNLITSELSLDVGAGKCEINQLKADKVDAWISVGNLEIEGEVSEKLNIDCGAGQVETSLNGSEQDYNYDISCQAGSIKIDEQRFSGLGTTKHLENGSGSNIVLNCGAGNIEIDFE